MIPILDTVLNKIVDTPWVDSLLVVPKAAGLVFLQTKFSLKIKVKSKLKIL